MDFGVSRRLLTIALVLLAVIYLARLTVPRDGVFQISRPSDHNTAASISAHAPAAAATNAPTPEPAAESQEAKVYGKIEIRDKVAVITDTEYTSRHIPLILHFHGVLGPDWPIIFYTSEEAIKNHLLPENKKVGSAVWQRAIEDGRIQVRTIPDQFNMTERHGVNIYLSRPWLWEQLAPAKHVLIFQADSVLCANGHRTVEDFLEWDWIAATLHNTEHLYNGGLSLRNREMILDILREGNNWEEEVASGSWTMGGEDVWFTRKMDQRGAHLPDQRIALQFACQHEWHVQIEKQPLGYHKVHKNIPNRLPEITEWCPEIALTAPGKLEQHE